LCLCVCWSRHIRHSGDSRWQRTRNLHSKFNFQATRYFQATFSLLNYTPLVSAAFHLSTFLCRGGGWSTYILYIIIFKLG
jgi:hypothetical protein